MFSNFDFFKNIESSFYNFFGYEEAQTETANAISDNSTENVSFFDSIETEAERCKRTVESLNIFNKRLGEFDLNNDQLFEKFQNLDAEVKEVILKTLWIAHFQPHHDPYFAENLLKANPKILLECKNSSGENLVVQVKKHYESKARLHTYCDSLTVFIGDSKWKSEEGQLQQFYSLPDFLQKKLAHLVWLEHGGRHNPHFGYWGYGEEQIKNNPAVLQSGYPSVLDQCHQFLENELEHSLTDQGVQKYFTIRTLPPYPISASVNNILDKKTDISSIPRKKVAMVAAELSGVISSGGLAGALDAMARAYGVENVRIILPKYDVIKGSLQNEMRIKDKYRIDFEGKVYNVFKAKIKGLSCFFIEDAEHFTIGLNKEGKPNNFYEGESDIAVKRRWLHFNSAATELSWKLYARGKIEVVHLHDAQTAIISRLFINRDYLSWKNGNTPATVLHVHNNNVPIYFKYGDVKALSEIGLPQNEMMALVTGVECSEMVVPVSQQFAEECQSEQFGKEMQRFFKIAAMQNKVVGITNGNSEHWNPQTDSRLKTLALNYWPNDPNLVDKLKRVRQILVGYIHDHFRVKFDPEKPIFFFVGRYDSSQKGIDQLPVVLNQLLKDGCQFICIGTEPDAKADEYLKEMEEIAKVNDGVLIIRDEKCSCGNLKWQQGVGVTPFGPILRAGIDIGVFPSIFEPCGLIQGEMHKMGKLAVATKTGGFVNTIFTSGPNSNGYLFDRKSEWNSEEQREAIRSAISQAAEDAKSMLKTLYGDDETAMRPYIERMNKIMDNALKSSWSSTFDGSISPIDSLHAVYVKALENKHKRGTIFVDISPLNY